MEANNPETKAKRKRKGHSLSHYMGGGILMEDFVVKQSKLLILIVFLIVIFISNRYSCSKKLAEIEILKRQIEDVKYENLIISTKLTIISRQSQIENLLDRKGMDLEMPKTPVYEIHK